MNDTEKLADARRVFDVEIEALRRTRDALDETFVQILDLVTGCKGRVILTGMGKPGHIAAKLAATLASLGTPAFHLHPAEALHGDLGMVGPQDVVIAISYSGESEEITRILPNIRMIGATLVGITGNPNSTLARACDVVQVFPKFDEACHLGLAPTSSTTATLVYGDALAVVASGVYGFTQENFGMYHPAGALGKKLIYQVGDIMFTGEAYAVLGSDVTFKDAIVEMSRKALGIVTMVDENGCLAGVLTDGDLRRLLGKGVDVYSLQIRDVMTARPTFTTPDTMAVNALQVLKAHRFGAMPVVDGDNRVVGTITLQAILAAGIVL